MISKIFYTCLISIYLSTQLTLQASLPSSNHYVGAVVEYYPVIKGENTTAIISENTKNYMTILKTASEKDVDIIVFPENGLYAENLTARNRSEHVYHSTYLPHPKEMHIPCHNTSSNVVEAVKAISCAASRHAMYIVINVREKEKCTGENCTKDNHNLYNTNVVFDRKGAVIAKYRKWNLFGERGLNVTSKPELSTFQTDFNVTFGQFICFDLLFQTPAAKLIVERKITDIIFSTHWYSELPYLTSNQIQSGWSYSVNANFLGSGFNAPSTGSGGSGIYAGKDGQMALVWSEKPVNALIIAKIPKIINGQRAQPINTNDATVLYFMANQIPTIANNNDAKGQQMLKMNDISPYTTQPFQPKNGTHNVTICDRGVCCNFTTITEHHSDLVKDNVKYYRYRFAVFNGIRSFSNVRTGGIELCSIITCTDDNPTSCNKRFDSNTIIVHPTTFTSIVISGQLKDTPNILRMPLSINTELQPLNVSDFTFTNKKLNATHVNLIFNLIKPRKDLMTFAIYGRNFTADGMPKTTSTSVKHFTSITLIMIMLILLSMINVIGINWSSN